MRFEIRVKPGASRTDVGGGYGDPAILVVAVNAPAVDGRANDAVLAAVAEALSVRPRDISIVRGHTGRTKLLEVVAPTEQEESALAARLAELVRNNA